MASACLYFALRDGSAPSLLTCVVGFVVLNAVAVASVLLGSSFYRRRFGQVQPAYGAKRKLYVVTSVIGLVVMGWCVYVGLYAGLCWAGALDLLPVPEPSLLLGNVALLYFASWFWVERRLLHYAAAGALIALWAVLETGALGASPLRALLGPSAPTWRLNTAAIGLGFGGLHAVLCLLDHRFVVSTFAPAVPARGASPLCE
ncbi:MAG: hypothetical protein MUF34_16745 [Polyangiaceae bacterium]|nr:hypothetical protein [Polyangiaceae bacterium]